MGAIQPVELVSYRRNPPYGKMSDCLRRQLKAASVLPVSRLRVCEPLLSLTHTQNKTRPAAIPRKLWWGTKGLSWPQGRRLTAGSEIAAPTLFEPKFSPLPASQPTNTQPPASQIQYLATATATSSQKAPAFSTTNCHYAFSRS